MRNGTLVIVLAAVLCAAFAGTLFAADEAAETEKFDQEAALMEFWKGPDDAVVGTVNGVSVTKRELQKTMWFWLAPRLLRDVLNQKMIKKAAADAGIELDWEQIEQKIEDSLKQGRVDNVDQLLAKSGATKQQFMSTIKLHTLAEKLVRSQMEVPDTEYDNWIKGRHILIKFPQEEKDKDKREEIAKTRIDEVAAKLKDGEDFAALADEYSEDPSNEADGVKKGGDLEWFTRDAMVPEFEKAAFDLEVGKVSEPVKTYFGYHLIRIDKLGKDATPEEKSEIHEKIIEKNVPMEMGRWFSGLQAASEIDNKLAGPPAPAPPRPTMRPRPSTAPRPAPRPAPKPESESPPPAPKPSEPSASPKPETPPPPAPPPAPE